MDKILGVVESVGAWKNGKGYFARVNGIELYGRDAPVFSKGNVVELAVDAGTGAFASRKEVKKASVNADRPPAAPNRPVQQKRSNEERELAERAYRAYQLGLLKECVEDAHRISESNSELVALAFFDKRCKPLHFYLGEYFPP